MSIETKRLILREMERADLPSLRAIMEDDEVMYAYGGAFTEEETRRWLDRQMENDREYGFGLWAAVLKETGRVIGQCGLTWQEFDGVRMLEVGYLFQKQYWHKGYATEAAIACREYAFDALNAEEVYSIIRDTNIPSQNVARRNGMTVVRRFIKHYRGVDMPHVVFSCKRRDRTPAREDRANGIDT